MLRSRIWLVAAIALVGITFGTANAQGNLKVGVISVARLVEQSPQFAAAQKKLEDEFGPRQRDLAAKQQSLRSQQERFQRDAPVMSEEERLNLERQIRDETREYQRTENELVEDFNLRRNEELGKLQREVLQTAQEYARTEKFDLLVVDANVIFASTAVDVTDKVLAVLNPGGGR